MLGFRDRVEGLEWSRPMHSQLTPAQSFIHYVLAFGFRV